MNPNQLATFDEAKIIASRLATMGGGVRPVNEDPEISGIYIPQYAGPYAAPADGTAKFYHLRFHNGADGFNAGLIRTTMQVFPTRWPLMLATEINAAANWASSL